MADMYLGNESGGFDLVGTTNIKNIDFEEVKISKEDYEKLSEEEKKSGVYLVTGLDDTEDGGGRADLISYDNTNSGLGSTNVQGAIDELNSNLNMRYNPETDTVQIYYNGQWNDWKFGDMQDVYLYNYGTDNTVVTGGWNAYAYKNSSAGSAVKAPTLTKNTNSMRIAMNPGGSWRKGAVFTENPINLTDYTTIEIVVSDAYKFGDGQGAIEFYMATSKQNNYTAEETTMFVSTIGTHTLDISEITGNYYLCFDIYSTTNVYADISSVKLIK